MPIRSAVAVAVGAAILAAATSVAAQTSPSRAATKRPARVYYDHYQASHRQRLRRETCMRDEDFIGKYCVKKCEKGYVTDNPTQVPRDCRSEKPLPEGQLPQGGKVQRGIVTPPPRRSEQAPPGA